MKLWKRVYLLTLIIITLIVNIGFLGITYFTYSQMLKEEKERCKVEFIALRENISADVSEMEKSIQLNEQHFNMYLRIYAGYYENDTQLIGVVADKVISEDSEYLELPKSDGICIEDEKYTTIYVSQILDDKHKEYRIIMRRELISFDDMWSALTPIYISAGVVLSLGTAAILALLVRYLLKPLDKLEVATRQVEKENWSARVDINGDSELAILGRSFNAMACSIEENVHKLEEQSRQKQELINNLAHEINTPITSIQGFADYMRMSELSEDEIAESLEFIVNESKRMKAISSIILSMAKMDGADRIEKGAFSIKDMCDRLESIYKNQFTERGVMLSIICEADNMYGNETLIESVFRNLINNGYHAVSGRDNGCISVSVSTKQVGINIIVSDNGCGIDEQHKEHIFEPFFRVDKARSRENGGSGLGLPFCKRIVELHNGTIAVESKADMGTTFYISLPFDNRLESI